MQIAKPMLEAAPRVTANAGFHPLIDPAVKARVFVLVRACAHGRASAEAHKAGLAKQAALIPSFAVFRQLCMEDLTEAFHEDRQIPARAQRNRRLVWLNFFKPFARLHGIGQALAIRAIDRQGHYTCELTEPCLPDYWEQWFKLGRKLGMSEATLEHAARSAGENPAQPAARASMRVVMN